MEAHRPGTACRRRAALAVLLASLLAVPGPGEGAVPLAPTGPDRLIEAAVDNHLVPVFGTFARQTGRLKRAVVRACTLPSDASRRAFLFAMEETVAAFGAIAVLRFGPGVETSEIARSGAAVSTASQAADAVEAALSGRASLPRSLAELRAAPAALQGLPALEHTLFAPLADGARPLSEGRCRLARMIAANLAGMAADMHADWADPGRFRGLFTMPGPDNARYASRRAVRQEIVEVALAGVSGLQAELSPLAQGQDPAGPFGEQRTFSASPLQVAFIEGYAGGLSRLLARRAFGRVLGEAATPALVQVRGHLGRALGAVSAVEPDDGIDGDERALLATATAHVAVTQVLMAGDVAAAADVSLTPFRELLR